jgi:hypothetical protein
MEARSRIWALLSLLLLPMLLLDWHAGISNVASPLFLTSLLLTSSLRQLPCYVLSVMILLSLLLLSTFLLPFPRVLDVAGVPGDIAVSNVLVVCC